MSSLVEIANLALASIGTRSSIASLTERSAEAAAFSIQYNPCLEAVLGAAHWNFARKQASLTLLKDASATPAGTTPQPWIYEYAYPADCVAARYVMPLFTDAASSSIFGPGFASVATVEQVPCVRFIISTDVDDSGNEIKVILTNQPQAQLVYTKRITNPQLFDGQFTMALSNFIGARLAIALTGDKALARLAFGVADATTKQARANNGNEGLTLQDTTPDWIRARGYDAGAFNGAPFIMAPVDLSFIA